MLKKAENCYCMHQCSARTAQNILQNHRLIIASATNFYSWNTNSISKKLASLHCYVHAHLRKGNVITELKKKLGRGCDAWPNETPLRQKETPSRQKYSLTTFGGVGGWGVQSCPNLSQYLIQSDWAHCATLLIVGLNLQSQETSRIQCTLLKACS